jgi:CRISPR-associated protein Cas2
VKLQQQVEQLIKPVEDSVPICVLDAGWVKRTITYGSQEPRGKGDRLLRLFQERWL